MNKKKDGKETRGRKKKILPKNWEELLETMSEKEQLEWLKHKTALMEKESILFPDLRNELKLQRENKKRKIIRIKEKLFKIIYQVKKDDKENKYSLNRLLKIYYLSKSGYYKYLKEREKRINKYFNDYLLIKEIFEKKKKRIGAKRMKLALEDKGIVMNLKKIRKIMRRYGLVCIVRRVNKSRVSLSKNLENRYVSNILNRKFKQKSPYGFLSTDITYLKYDNNKRWAFLSVVKDISSGEIVSYELSQKMNLDLVLKTIDNLEKYYLKNSISLKNILLHSDQGFQYTNIKYHKKLKDLGIIQSMSRRGNSVDNAIIETFFGHLKDEIITKDLDFSQLQKEIDKYMIEYNYQRRQWDKKKMTPIEYRNHLLKT